MLVHIHFILLWPFSRKLIQLVSWGNILWGLEIWVSGGCIHCIEGGVLNFFYFWLHYEFLSSWKWIHCNYSLILVEGDVNLISDSVISNFLNNTKFGCFILLKNNILGLELTKKNAMGDWSTWLDDNSPVDFPPLLLNRLLQHSTAPNSLQNALIHCWFRLPNG